jgi:hypothetical protein
MEVRYDPFSQLFLITETGGMITRGTIYLDLEEAKQVIRELTRLISGDVPGEMQSIILQIQSHLAQGHKHLALNKEDLREFLMTTLIDVDIDFQTVKLVPGHQIPRGQVCAVTSNQDEKG